MNREALLLDPEVQESTSPTSPLAMDLLTAALDREGVEAAGVYIAGSRALETPGRRELLRSFEPGRPAGRHDYLVVVGLAEPDAEMHVLKAGVYNSVARAMRRAGCEIELEVKFLPRGRAPHLALVEGLRRAGALLVDRTEGTAQAPRDPSGQV